MHDAAKWEALQELFGLSKEESKPWKLASLHQRLGGVGLRSARCTAPVEYWASWADALQMLQQHVPEACAAILRQLAGETTVPCLVELRAAEKLLKGRISSHADVAAIGRRSAT